MALILTIVSVLFVLVANELYWRLRKPNDEISRKTVHILVGCFVAFWPYYLSWTQIQLLGLAFVIAVYVSKKLKIFRAIHSVQRPTWGEMFFGVSVVLISLITHDKAIFTTAILAMGLADGLASIVGSYFGKSTNYNIFGYTKSIIGSLTFFIVVAVLLIVYAHRIHHPESTPAYLTLALATTALENFSFLGLDNLFVPLLITIALK